jgi:hypothetical protein
MADAVQQQHYAAPAAVAHVKEERYIQQTPIWVVVVRGFQVLLGFIILVMAGWLIHGYAMAANGFALACVGQPGIALLFDSELTWVAGPVHLDCRRV